MTLTLGGLPAANYHWRSYHHDTENMNTPFTIELSTDGGASWSEVHSGQMTDSTPGGNPPSAQTETGAGDPDPANLPSTANFRFYAPGGDVILRFTPLAQVAVHQQFFGINGFELAQLSLPALKDGLVNYWNLDSNLEDCAHDIPGSSSSVEDDGSFGGANGTGGISYQSGLFGDAIEQDGASGPAQNNGHVRVERSADTLFGANATNPGCPSTVTSSMWVQVAGFDTGWQAVLAHGEGAQYRIARRGGNPRLAYAGGVGEGPDGGPNVDDGQWHHVVAISDQKSGNTRLYVDGSLVSTGGNPNINDGQGGGTLPLNIGANPNTGAQNREWWGKIDDVAQWNRALSDPEIALLYGGGPATAVPLKQLALPQMTVYCGPDGPGESYWQDFDFPDATTDLGDGTTIGSSDGLNQVLGGALRMTDSLTGGTRSSFRIPALATSSNGWHARFDVTLTHDPGHPNPNPADGFSFNYGAIPARTGGGAGPDQDGAAEEGWGGGIQHISFEADTWRNPDAEQGFNIAVNGTDVAGGHINGVILPDDGAESATVEIWWSPADASFTTTGFSVTNAAFNALPHGFAGDNSYGFGISARTGGATETLRHRQPPHRDRRRPARGRTARPQRSTSASTCPERAALQGVHHRQPRRAQRRSSSLGTPGPASRLEHRSEPRRSSSIPAGGRVTIKLQFDATGPGGPRRRHRLGPDQLDPDNSLYDVRSRRVHGRHAAGDLLRRQGRRQRASGRGDDDGQLRARLRHRRHRRHGAGGLHAA